MSESVVASSNPYSGVRPEVVRLSNKYIYIRDVLNDEVENRGEIYLPCPSNLPISKRTDEDLHRYITYSQRATFINYTGRTLTGFIGQIFSRDAEVKVPKTLEALIQDASGDGLPLIQIAKDACAEGLSMGRGGLLVDYPQVDTPSTQAQLENGDRRPVINLYLTENILDWDYRKRGSKMVLCYLVLKETYNDRDPVTQVLTIRDQWRVLSLNADDVYEIKVWREIDNFGDRDVTPRANGKTLNEIPFAFFGSVNNDAEPDNPPMYDLAKVNVAHYRNSADYEESVFVIGQPTLIAIGIKTKWWETVLNKVLRFGSRNGIALESDSDAKILQAQPNVLAKEAMDQKQEQMAAMGAEFLRESGTEKTATEAAINDSARTSAMSNVAKNVSAAFQYCLEWAAIFQGSNEKEVVFKLNSEFDLTRMTAADRAQLIKEHQEGLVSWTEYRNALRKAGFATQPDEEAKAEIAEKEAAEVARAAAEFAATTAAANPGNLPGEDD